jgi:hypothetical protein
VELSKKYPIATILRKLLHDAPSMSLSNAEGGDVLRPYQDRASAAAEVSRSVDAVRLMFIVCGVVIILLGLFLAAGPA